jgi:hypothetical protein
VDAEGLIGHLTALLCSAAISRREHSARILGEWRLRETARLLDALATAVESRGAYHPPRSSRQGA